MIHEQIDFEREQSLSEIFNNIRKHFIPYWAVYAICVAVGILGAFLYLRYTSPVYVVESKLLVKDENKGLGSSNSNGVTQLALFDDDKKIENELEIIKSRPVLFAAIKNSNAEVKFFRKARIRNVSVVQQFPFQLIPLHPDSTQWAKSALLKFDLPNNKFSINKNDFDLKDESIIVINSKDTFIVRCSPNQLQHWSKDEFLVQVNSLNTEINNVLQVLDVKRTSNETSIIDLSLNTDEPSRGLSLLNSIVNEYNRASIADKRLIAQYTLDFINERLALVTNELDSVERHLERYKSHNSIVDISEQSKVFLAEVQQNDLDLNKINVQLSVLEEVEKYMKGKGSNPGSAPSLMGIEDPLLLSMLPKLYDAEFQLQKQIQISGQKDDATIVMKSNVEQLKQSISEAIENLKNNLQAAQKNINANLLKQNELLKKVPNI